MNFKLKVVSAAAVLAFGVAHQAHALTIVGNSTTTLATEQLPSVGSITLNNIGISATNQGIVAGNSYSIRFTLLGGGTWAAANTALLEQINQNSNTSYATETYTTSGAGTTVLTFTHTSVAGVTTSPANTIFRLSNALTAGVGASLVLTGVNDNGCPFTTGDVRIRANFFDSNGSETDLPEGTLNQGIVVVAQQGITGAINASAAPILDVLTALRPGAAPAASKFLRTLSNNTAVNVLNAPIGTFKFSETPGLQGQGANPLADYNLAAATDGGASVTVSADQGFGVGSSLYLIDDTANTACSADATAGITAGTAIVPNSLTTPVGEPNTRVLGFNVGTINDPAQRAKTYTICYRLTGLTGNVPTSQFAGFATQLRTAPTIADFAAGNTCRAPLAKASINGGIIAVRNFVPASVNAFGWRQQIRIINAGSVPTSITAFFQYADGTTSSTQTIVPTAIAAGGSVTITNSQIEAAMGTSIASNVASNPRLVITGATERLRVQNFIIQPGGNWVEASGGQDDGAGPAGTNN